MSRDPNTCLKCTPENREDGYCFHDIADALGLEIIASFDDPQSSYSFDEFVIFRRLSDGALFWGADSGCSCPEPFEEVKSCDDLSAITPNS